MFRKVYTCKPKIGHQPRQNALPARAEAMREVEAAAPALSLASDVLEAAGEAAAEEEALALALRIESFAEATVEEAVAAREVQT